MRLTTYSDYCLRVLMYVGAREPGISTIDEIVEAYGISRGHLMKVVHRLGRTGYLKTIRGRGGGIRLGCPPEAINLAALIRATEEDLAVVECFQADGRCPIADCCVLKRALSEALDAFLGVLERYTLADLLRPQRQLRSLLGVSAVAR